MSTVWVLMFAGVFAQPVVFHSEALCIAVRYKMIEMQYKVISDCIEIEYAVEGR